MDWEGEVLSVQPRIRLTRSFDQRSHSYLGYVLRMHGTLAGEVSVAPPPLFGVPPALEVHRERGHRRLAAVTYSTKCAACIWGCEMAVEMIIDQWRITSRNRHTP
jgi:hypothetical protein